MNTTELIEIAKECCFSRQVVGDETALITFRSEQLQQFAQRIEQPLQARITEITAKSYNGLNEKNRQIEQLREALQELLYAHTDKAIALTIKALEETK